MRRFAIALVVSSVVALAQPQIALDGVRNSASYTPQGFLNAGIAQGSIFVIFGSGLGPDQLAQASIPLPTDLAGVSVRIDSAGRTSNAYMVFASANAVAAIMPSGAPVGPATVTVFYGGQASNAAPIAITRRKIGIYTLNQAGTGPAVAQNYIAPDDQPVNTLVTPARPGQLVTLWATGLGAVKGDEAVRPQPGDLGPIRLVVGGVDAKVRYAGRSGCCLGADQIIFEVPAGVEGCYVPVIAVTGSYAIPNLVAKVPLDGPSSNFATISISSTGSCTDPTGLTGEEIQRIQNSGSARVGALEFVGLAEGLTRDTAAARFSRVDFTRLLQSRGVFGLPAFGSCLAYESPADPVRFDALDAGPALNITGPAGTRQLQRQTTGDYSASFGDSYLSPGSYSVDNGAGGTDVGAFHATFNVPLPVRWLNKAISGENVSPELDWTGGDENGFVVITSVAQNNLSSATTICTERTATARFRIPSYAYAITGVDGVFGANPNTVSIGTASPPARFNAPGIDIGLIDTVMFVPGTFIK